MLAAQSSGLQTGSAAIVAGSAYLLGITLIQASAAATLITYNNATTNAGTATGQCNTTVNSSSNTVMFNIPVFCEKGIYAAMTGTGANYIVHYALA